MQIHVVLHSILREKLPAEAKGRATLEMEEGSTVGDVFRRLGIGDHVAFAVNGGIERDEGRVLADRDQVEVFRPAGGGRGA